MRKTTKRCQCCGQPLVTCPTCNGTGKIKKVAYAAYSPSNEDYLAGPGSGGGYWHRGEPTDVNYTDCPDCKEVAT